MVINYLELIKKINEKDYAEGISEDLYRVRRALNRWRINAGEKVEKVI